MIRNHPPSIIMQSTKPSNSDLYGAFDVNLFSISYSFSHLIYSHLTEVRFWTFGGIIASHTCIRWVDETRTIMQ